MWQANNAVGQRHLRWPQAATPWHGARDEARRESRSGERAPRLPTRRSTRPCHERARARSLTFRYLTTTRRASTQASLCVCYGTRRAEELARCSEDDVEAGTAVERRRRVRLRYVCAACGAKGAQPAAELTHGCAGVCVERQIDCAFDSQPGSLRRCSRQALQASHLEQAARTAIAHADGYTQDQASASAALQGRRNSARLPHLRDGACSSHSIARCSIVAASTSSMAATTHSEGGCPCWGPPTRPALVSASASSASTR